MAPPQHQGAIKRGFEETQTTQPAKHPRRYQTCPSGDYRGAIKRRSEETQTTQPAKHPRRYQPCPQVATAWKINDGDYTPGSVGEDIRVIIRPDGVVMMLTRRETPEKPPRFFVERMRMLTYTGAEDANEYYWKFSGNQLTSIVKAVWEGTCFHDEHDYVQTEMPQDRIVQDFIKNYTPLGE